MADQKLTAQSPVSSYLTTDIIYVVTDPEGTPASGQMAFSVLLGKMPTAPLPSTAAGSDVGSGTLPWKDIYFAGSSGTPGTNNFKITGASTSGTRTITFPDASGTVTLGGNSFAGTGDVVRATSPTLVTPTLGVATVTTVNKITITAPATGATLTIIDGKTVTVNNTLTLAGTDGTTITFQGTDTYVGRATTDTLSNKTLASPTVTGSITFPDNVRQTFNPGANAAGLNVGSVAGDPDTPSNGDLWYDSTANELIARINGANVALGVSGLTVGTTAIASGTATRLLYETSGNVLGEISGATSDGTNVTFGSGNLLATAPAFTTTATVTRSGIGATSSDGIILQNTTDAAAGAQQWSPRLRLHGEGWKTNATAASQEVDWAVEVRPVQGAANPTADLRFSASINGGAYTEWGYLTSGGQLILSGTGTAALPTIQNVASVGNPTGINLPSGSVRFVISSVTQAIVAGNTAIGLQLNSGLPFSWGSGTPDATSPDTALFRNAAAVVAICNGTAGQWGALKSGTRDAGTNTVTVGLTVGHQSTGTPAAGLGSAILFNINSTTTADQNAAQIAATWTTATHASRTAKITFNLVNNAAALAQFAELTPTDFNLASGLVYKIDGTQVVGARQAFIADPAGGAVVDAESRTAIASILDLLIAHGLMASS